MVFAKMSMQDSAWFKVIRDKSQDTDKSPTSDLNHDENHWSCFDLADLLEQGLGPGLTSNFVEPPDASEEKEQRLIVECQPEKKSFVLTTEGGQALLVALTLPDNAGFEIFSTTDGTASKGGRPAFLLNSNQKRDQWTLFSVRCENCASKGRRKCGTRELAKLYHYCETVGDGNAFCMDVELPESPEDNSPGVVCSACADPCIEVTGRIVTSRRPKWNTRQKTLTMDFRGRCSMASAKNFILEDEDKKQLKLLFGKVGVNKFVLDYRHPLGMIQAFSAALSATHWK